MGSAIKREVLSKYDSPSFGSLGRTNRDPHMLIVKVPHACFGPRFGTLRFTYGHVCPLIIFHSILVYMLTVRFPFTHLVSMSWLIVYSDLLV